MKPKSTILMITCTAICSLPLAAAGPETFTGRAIDTSGARMTSTAHFTLHIDEYATDEEIAQHAAVLAETGSRGLEKVLWKLDRGWIKIGTSLGHIVGVARSIDTDGGRIIRAVTDRPIQLYEVRHGLRSVHYPFGFIELELDADGNGEGRLIAAAKLKFTKDGTLVIEQLGTRPFRLMNVKTQKEE